MRIFSLKFSDGKSCRCIVMEPLHTVEQDRQCLIGGFNPGYCISAERVLPRVPEKLPWRREGKGWAIEGFALEKLEGGQFRLSWLGGELVSASKEEISAAVRKHWAEALK